MDLSILFPQLLESLLDVGEEEEGVANDGEREPRVGGEPPRIPRHQVEDPRRHHNGHSQIKQEGAHGQGGIIFFFSMRQILFCSFAPAGQGWFGQKQLRLS